MANGPQPARVPIPTGCDVAILPVVKKDLPISPRFPLHDILSLSMQDLTSPAYPPRYHRRGSDVGRIGEGRRCRKSSEARHVGRVDEDGEDNICMEANPSDDEVEKNSTTAGGRGSRRSIPHSSYVELSSHFGVPENYAESCGSVEAGYWLRRAKMSFIAIHASAPRGRQILGSTVRER
ncbi:unnamed protein product, partial [Ascophyllum nodosum]